MRPPNPSRSQTSLPDSTPESSLLARYARRFGLAPAAAEERLFYECVPWGKRFPVRLHRWLRPNLYGSDVRLVHEAGLADSRQEVMDALDRWHHRAARIQAWEREAFGWRVSGRLLLAVARSVFQANEMSPGNAPTSTAAHRPHRDASLSRPLNDLPEPARHTTAVSHWIQLNG
jgi:hypothetical protein